MAASASVVEDTLSCLYGSIDGSNSWADAMGRVAAATGADRFTFNSVGHDGSFHHDSAPFDPEGLLMFAQDFADKDLRLQRIVSQRRRGLIHTGDVMTAQEIAQCPVHNEFYRLFPECWNAGILVLEHLGGITAPTIQRRASKGDFTPEETRLLEVLGPHICRVVELQALVSARTLGDDGIVAALDGLDDGVIIFDHAGFVLHMNAPARAIVAIKDGLELTRGVLRASHRDSRPVLFDMMTRTLRVAAGLNFELPRPIGLRRPGNARPLIVRAFVSPTGKDANRMGVLTVQDRASWQAPTADTVRAATGLTPAESRLAVALLEGESVIAYARREGLSEHTARSHLKQIRSKLGVTRQANVVAVLARLFGS
ncbi:helix-turn-helix transcriptional regulator [Aurantimonas sp. C2-6-R+9]|uniref:helix-turn-helix transcriptional regulator n=1 Tax=unclassified Aurantimonas TaxID=2638230 RepID=UPI002E16BA1A|nr:MULTISPECIES: helix-turn-helix transcriptional regulator [unclassified Aurantimonas]MEC5292624.1 helix-turn-helix transcriptional regulator [Aurantimonas sp. C2-3-R2]MEC5325366.1 helix-turn-helix transcriptional regulator [Aurantimonas sp. A3-2-R12]MEC5382862.1 helix-turn-helix transcriptional regulator [Aurantimonas sp. C2-6-R+9]MEC5413679.1 helix-turn-helix transcriptional regulator [Aurantimonas sp. C2-4-R8]